MWSGIWSVATTRIGFWIWTARLWLTSLVSVDQSKNIGAIDMKMDWSVLEEKSSFTILGLTLLLNWIWALTFSLLLKLPPRKLQPLFILWSLFLLRLPVSINLPYNHYMEYCCKIRAGAPSCYLELLDKLQKPICRNVGPSLAASLAPLAHHQNVASLSLFCI